MTFSQEYLVAPPPDEGEAFRECLSLWCWYYVTTEEFDRSVCAARRDGVAVPTSTFERMLCTRFAALQMKDVTRTAKSRGFHQEIIDRARNAACAMSLEQQERWISVYPPRFTALAIV